MTIVTLGQSGILADAVGHGVVCTCGGCPYAVRNSSAWIIIEEYSSPLCAGDSRLYQVGPRLPTQDVFDASTNTVLGTLHFIRRLSLIKRSERKYFDTKTSRWIMPPRIDRYAQSLRLPG